MIQLLNDFDLELEVDLLRSWMAATVGYGGDSAISGSSKLERVILSSGKLVILDKLLDRLHETNHRILIFSRVSLHVFY